MDRLRRNPIGESFTGAPDDDVEGHVRLSKLGTEPDGDVEDDAPLSRRATEDEDDTEGHVYHPPDEK